MKYMLLCVFTAVGMFSCASGNGGNHEKIDQLLALDSIVSGYPVLLGFSSLKLYTKNINGVPICDSIEDKCKQGEKYYHVVLDSLGIPVSDFDSLVSKIDAISFKKFYRYNDYSIWVENGAFGDIYGYLINHNAEIPKVESFTLDKRYHIGIGKEVRKNVYYFSSYYE